MSNDVVREADRGAPSFTCKTRIISLTGETAELQQQSATEVGNRNGVKDY